MTDRSDIEQVLDGYLAEGGEQLPDRVLDAVLDQIDHTEQRHASRAPWRSRAMSTLLRPLLAAAAVVAVIVVGASFLTGRPAGLPSPTPMTSPRPTAGPTAGALPALTLPGARGGAPGEYGWTGYSGAGASMHWVTDDGEVAAMRFARRDSCFRGSDVVSVPVTIAGYEGAYVEPYIPPVTFVGVGDEITRAHELKIGPGTLCIYVTWHPTTTPDELGAALGILDTLRAEYREDGSIRIVFTLADSWDTG